MPYSRLLSAHNGESPVIDNTPWDCYEVDGVEINVKREDMCCPKPGPEFSKIRGLYAHMLNLKEFGVETVGILDTVHSKAGWATAYVGHILGMTVYDFYPVTRKEIGTGAMRMQQRYAASFGAIMVPMAATAGYVLEAVAKNMLMKLTGEEAVMLPVGLKLLEAIDANMQEVLRSPVNFDGGSWIVSTSSGTIAAAIWKAFNYLKIERGVKLYLVSGYKRKERALRDYIEGMSGHLTNDNIVYVDEGYEYKQAVDYPCPFPCNPYYDLKAWKWLMEQDLSQFKQPIVFWNIGA